MNLFLIWKYKNWIAIAILCFISLGQLAYTNYLAGQLIKAEAKKSKAVADAVKPYEIAAKEQRDKFNTASAAYEKLKSEQRVNNEVVIKEVQKIIDRPIYYNICIDADGLQQLNSLITSDTS